MLVQLPRPLGLLVAESAPVFVQYMCIMCHALLDYQLNKCTGL